MAALPGVSITRRALLQQTRFGNQTRINEIAFSLNDSVVVVLAQADDQRSAPQGKQVQSLYAHNLQDSGDHGNATSCETKQMYTPDKYSVCANGIALGPVTTITKGGRVSKTKSSIYNPMVVCHDTSSLSTIGSTAYVSPISLDIVDLTAATRRSRTTRNPLTPPLAFSPDGELIAGVSCQEPTEIILLEAPDHDLGSSKVVACIPGHLAPVTHFAFMPDGQAIVSLATNGAGRLVRFASTNSDEHGHLVKKFHVASNLPASQLRVSPDGRLIVSVWGQQVVLWYPDANRQMSYHLGEVRLVELWPLTISPDCEILVGRTESGIDIVDVATGGSVGSLTWTQTGRTFATAAAFSHDGKVLAIGRFNGQVTLHNIQVGVGRQRPLKGAGYDPPPTYTEITEDDHV